MKGKVYSDEIKEQILKEVEETGNVTLVARNHGIPPTTINTWIKKEKNSSDNVLYRGLKSSSFNSNNYGKEIEKENNQLKKLLGEKDLEIAILKDLLKKQTDNKR